MTDNDFDRARRELSQVSATWYAVPAMPLPPRGGPSLPAPAEPDTEPAAPAPAIAAGRDVRQDTRNTRIEGDGYIIEKLFASAELTDKPSRNRRSRRLGPEALLHSVAVTEPPAGLDIQVDRLDSERLVVVASPPEAGQVTAAKYLAHQLCLRHPFLTVVREVDEDEWDLAEIVESQNSATLVIADFTESTRSFAEVRKLLDEVRHQLAKDEKYLILLVPRDRAGELELDDRIHDLRRPPASGVYKRHIGDSVPDEVLSGVTAEDWVAGQLATAWPPAAARLARLTVELHRTGTVTAPELAQELRDAHGDWTHQLEHDCGDIAAAEARALALAGAAFEGGTANTVAEAGELLLLVSRWRTEPVHPLEQPSPLNRLRDLKEFRFDPASTSFIRPEYGAAILPYSWKTFPQLRNSLLSWLIRLPYQLSRLSSAEEARLVERLTILAGRVDNPIVREVTAGWILNERLAASNRGRYSTAASLAFKLLSTAALDRAVGRDTRQVMYEWAYGHGKDQRLKLLTARVCGDSLAIQYPLNALTRLKHLAGNGDERVREEVHTGLTKLADHIGAANLLGNLVSWCDHPMSTRIEVLAGLVDEFAAQPRRLEAVLASRRSRKFLRQLFDVLPREELSRLVVSVATTASQMDDEAGERIVDQFVNLTTDDQRRYDSLMYVANKLGSRTWEDLSGHMRVVMTMLIKLRHRSAPALRFGDKEKPGETG